MKHLTVVLLCLLLCGCGRQTSTPPPEVLPETQAATMAGMYDPDHPMEKAYPGQVRAYPLTLRKVRGIRTAGTDVLVLSGYGSTRLTLLTGEDLREKAGLNLNFSLDPEDPSLQVHETAISYFDPVTLETVVLDFSLRETRRITGPEGLSGKPILSEDGKTLYYCTGWSVVAWDLESGIRRTLKELSYESQELTALHLKDQILECSIRHNGGTTKLLLSADQGLEISSLPEGAALYTRDNRYFTVFPGGYQTLLIYADTDTAPNLLLPEENWHQEYYLSEDHAAVILRSCETGNRLDYYELNTGILRASILLEELQTPKAITNSKDHAVYILTYDPEADCDILYRWDVLRQTPDPSNVTSCKTEYHSADNPDMEKLSQCREYARSIGEKYGIQVRIWEDALAVQPWDYQFQPEHLVPVLQKELDLLDKRLAQYPEDVLQQTTDHFSGLTLCLVRQINGTEDGHGLNAATGIQFFEDNHAYVVITTGKHSRQALYHELYHVMETHLLTESTALDQWDSLNPAGFVYGSIPEKPDVYLQGQTRAFVDRYSMSASKEDRARILEYAMLPGKEEIFRSEYMQRKLRTICEGLRDAYNLEKSPGVLPWEQYLVNPLTPKE